MADQDLEEVEVETSLRDDILTAADEVEYEVKEGEAEEKAQAEVPEDQTIKATTHKPPVDWAPEVKTKFGKLEPDIQAAIAERERGINETLQQTASIRQEYDSFNQMLSPYLPLMQAEGVSNPVQAIRGLLETTAALQMGNQQQKASRIAQLIKHYNIDIDTLDRALVGEAPANPQQSQFEQMLNQRLAPVDQLLQRVHQNEQRQAQQSQTEAGQTIQQFAADPVNVHFDSVRETMADFLDMASQRGQQMSLQEAYQRACLADPQIAPLVVHQFQQQAARGSRQNIAGKRQAASSIHGRPASASSGNGLTEDMSLREAIEAQFAGGDRI